MVPKIIPRLLCNAIQMQMDGKYQYFVVNQNKITLYDPADTNIWTRSGKVENTQR